jgi:response regulator of citrate/malate metabolism
MRVPAADDDEHIWQQAVQDGIMDFLVKPFDAAQLLEASKALRIDSKGRGVARRRTD